MKKNKKKKAFTLVELLAVIVILAIILVIAVPQIVNTIKASRLGAIESSAKLIASNADEYYLAQQTLDPNYTGLGVECSDVSKLSNDYESCSITYNNGKATVKLKGAAGSKFNNIKCSGTKDNMSCQEKGALPGYTNAVEYLTSKIGQGGLIKDDHNDLRYQGENPNNYVTFNGEEAGWRIVGVFDGRVKLVKAASIGDFSWDSSSSTDSHGNSGYGINQWGESGTYPGADLMRLLNDYYYNGVTNGTCYNELRNASTTCTFTGLTGEAKDLIGEATWYTGGVPYNSTVTLADMYAGERGEQGKMCTQGTTYCNDEVERTYTWAGKVGLIYPSDYGYASGNSNCATNIIGNRYCGSNWMSDYGWTISPSPISSRAYIVWLAYSGLAYNYNAHYTNGVRPSVYLISDIQMKATNPNDTTNAPGSINNPYVFAE